jgi:hypothetical protein
MNPKNASKILCNLALALVFILPTQAGAQAYVPLDGELDLTNCGLVTVLDPHNPAECLAGFTPTQAALKKNVYQFSKILIPAGKTLKLTGQHFNMAPLYFLTGNDPQQDGYAVDIAGTIDLSGASGESGVQGNGTPHSPAMPGPGGWPGGVFFKRNGVIDAELGSGGGPAGGPQGGAPEGRNSVKLFMNPFFGGSGGAAAATDTQGYMCSGSAGGGALEIVSSGRVRINGVVDARGGARPNWPCSSWDFSGAGAGGSVRILARSILGSGNINVASTYAGVGGAVRLEASDGPSALGVVATNGRVSRVTRAANASYLPGEQPRLWIRSIGGSVVPQCVSGASQLDAADPCGPTSGGFNPADFNIATGEAVEIVVHAINVPSGRSPQARLRVYNEESGAAVPVTVILGAPEGDPPPPYLEGRFSVTFEPGFSRIQLDASWTP